MKASIHPKYHSGVQVRCACGTVHTIGSTKEAYTVDICSSCHPFYTGKQKLVDTAGRVDKFRERQKAFELKKAEGEALTKHKKAKGEETVEEKIVRKAQEKADAKEVEKATKTAKKPAAKAKAAPKKAATKKK